VTEKLLTQRSRSVQHHGAKETGKATAKASVSGSVIGDDDEMAALAPEEPKGRGKRTAPATSAKAKRAPIAKEMKPTPSKEKHPTKHLAEVDDEDDEEDDNLVDAFVKRKWPSQQIANIAT
jgi:Ino eighty subunit 1